MKPPHKMIRIKLEYKTIKNKSTHNYLTDRLRIKFPADPGRVFGLG